MKSITVFIIPILVLLSCNSKKFGEEKVDLENFEFNFDIDNFYSNTKILYNYNSTEVDYDSEKQFIQIDTVLYESIEIAPEQSEEKKLSENFLQYEMMIWNKSKKIAFYNNISFERIGMMKSFSGDFVSLFAQNESDTDKKLNTLITYLSKKHGKPKIVDKVGYHSYNYHINYVWELNDRTIIVSTKTVKNLAKNSIEITTTTKIGESNTSTLSDKEKRLKKNRSITETTIFILNKKYQPMILNNSQQGTWIYLKTERY